MDGKESGVDGPFHPTPDIDIRDPKPATGEVEPKALTLETGLMDIARQLGLQESASIDQIRSAITHLQENQR